MAKLWRKYLALRRDGTVLDCPYFVLAAADSAAPAALRAYAAAATHRGMADDYTADVFRLARSFEAWRHEYRRTSDPDAPPHRPDDPEVAAVLDALPASVPYAWRPAAVPGSQPTVTVPSDD